MEIEKLIQEHSELVSKHKRLFDFITSEEYGKLTTIEQNLLNSQLNYMFKYIQVLAKRIRLHK